MGNLKLIMGAGLVGVAIGMLLAPKKGSDLQASIFETIDELGGEMREFKEKVLGIAENVKTKALDVKEKVETKVEEVKEGVDDFKTTGEHLGAIFS